MLNSNANLAENKLMLLYLLNKMNLPVAYKHIQQFALDKEYMDYFSLTSYLAELVSSKYIFKSSENNKTIYNITESGIQVLSYFENRIPSSVKDSIIEFVELNKKKVEKELEVKSTYYQNDTKQYIVKCGVYESGSIIMEVNLSVVSKDAAKSICKNWDLNFSEVYPNLINSLLTDNNKNK